MDIIPSGCNLIEESLEFHDKAVESVEELNPMSEE